MKKLAFLLALFLFITSCQNEKSNLNLAEKHYMTNELPACKNEICPKIDIQLLKAQGDSPLAQSINNATEDLVATSLTMSPDEEAEIKTIDQGITNFIEAFRTAQAEFPESEAAQGYEFTTASSVSLQNDNLLSLKLETYSYWGGAHGYSDTKYLNFDLKSGEPLTKENLFKDRKKFIKIAEEKFRKQQHIPVEANINESGYFFENDRFVLPNTIGFDKNFLILIYNPYEVAPYAEGQIIVEIPHNEAAPFLSIPL